MPATETEEIPQWEEQRPQAHPEQLFERDPRKGYNQSGLPSFLSKMAVIWGLLSPRKVFITFDNMMKTKDPYCKRSHRHLEVADPLRPLSSSRRQNFTTQAKAQVLVYT